MNRDELNLHCCLLEALSQNDFGDAAHYSRMLIRDGFLKSRRGWRLFECEKYEFEGHEYGCGTKFLRATRDFSSPSSDTCPVCSEKLESETVYPQLGFYDGKLKINESCNLTDTPKDVILIDGLPTTT